MMKKIFEETRKKLQELREMDSNLLLYRFMPSLIMELLGSYFRLEIEGIDNIPLKGPAIIAPNHSGYAGLDALILMHEINKATGRVPRVLMHSFWFLAQTTAVPATKVGFIKATTENGLQQLRKNNLIVLFPEGEYGNFKASTKAYKLQEFKRGFVRMALTEQCAIIPTLVLGAEESQINLASLKASKYFPGAVLPLPLNIIPLPSKWKIIFLKPIHLPYKPEAAGDKELVHETAQEIRESMQKALAEELAKRGSAFF